MFDDDRAAVVARARDAGVATWMIAAARPEHWDRVERVARETHAYWALGVHPWYVGDMPDADLDRWLAALAHRPRLPAIGETGLDKRSARNVDARSRQRRSTRAHLALAATLGIPVVLHCVGAYGTLVDLVGEANLGRHGGMVHAWTGSAAMVQPAIQAGLYLSFGGALARSARTREALRTVPDDRLLLETDAPDQAFVRGMRSEPGDLLDVANLAAALRGQTVDHVLRTTADNARRLFGAGERS